MEILDKFKQNGYFTAELYHLLAKKKISDLCEEITPSTYKKEMKMSTAERLQSLNAIIVDNIVHSGKTSNLVLSFTPKLIVFQNFKPNDTIVAKFSVQNLSKSPTFLNMVYKESSYFFIKPCGGQLWSRLAPGISVTFAITFKPVQYEDYIHKVTFYTDVDRYVLPLIAMGPRPVFDFPDEVIIPKVPLKIENHVLFSVHNIGMVTAGFTLTTKWLKNELDPFSVQPESGYLDPNQKIDIKVAFKTMHLGERHGIMNAIFETGENFCIKLSGFTYTVNIQLEKQVVRFLDTYNTLVRQQTFKITNKSDNIISYMCMKHNSVKGDFENKLKLATLFYNVQQSESAKSNKLVYYDVLSSEEHERVYTRVFYDEIQALVSDESLQFQDTHFSITPVTGKLWPNKTTEITITFAPKLIGEFEAIAFLDIDGVNERVPLKMVGTSLPPHIILNLETLDMDQVYINKTYNYEIVAMNRGHINGLIVYKKVPPLFGSIITCTPEVHCMRPGDRHPFIISFINSQQGPFFEEINFAIRETSVILKLYLKGVVIYPSLMFNMPCLDFGMVSLGLPKTLEVEVINESVVHVDASVKISSDGPEISSITLIDYSVADKPKPQIPQWPREFNIEPQKVNIGPESRVTIKVTLTANLIRANQTSLELEIDKSDSPPIVLPVTFNAMVPIITPVPDIKLRDCFLDFLYKQQVHVSFRDFWGYFTLLEPEVESTLEVNVGVKEGIIKPNSTVILPVTIKTSVLGVQEYSIQLYLFGLSKPIEVCHITGCGVRPIVTCNPTGLHWGQVKLLSRTQKILTLCNDSPVVVNFKVSLLNRDGRWQIFPTEGYIEPEAETELCASLYLIDADSYTNKVLIHLEKVKDILVPLSATGIGTSILVGELRGKVTLGRHFTKIPLNCKVVMENCGTRMHALEWSERYKAPKTKQHTNGFFSLEPRVFKMAAGEKLDLKITGLSYKVTTVKEMWYLVGSVEGINKKELLLECQIVAEFVDPKIEVSSSSIEFQYDYGPYNEFYKLTDLVSIKNVSKLPLDLEISVKPPFAIIQKQSSYKILDTEENLCACIWYRESDLNIPSIYDNKELSKVSIDYLTLKPIDPLRKGALNFFQDINKIKCAFNLTHSIEERLEDQEFMKIQILFDSTKHTTLKSKVYCDLLRLKFKGHKNKDVIELIGKINFPNIFVFSPRVDFQYILNGSIESKLIKIQNVTPLMVCYRFNWKKCVINYTMPYESKRDGIISQVSFYRKGSTTETTRSGAVEELHEILACRTPAEDILADNYLDTSNSPEIVLSYHQDTSAAHSISSQKLMSEDPEIFNCQMMQRISPMLDTKYDSKFEWSYKFSKLNKVHNLSINDLFQLIPHSGLLKPHEVQYINIIFRPKINMSVRAMLECEVLGGPPETITVTGQSSNLLYKINTHKINFKIRSFHENATEHLLISNVAQLPFEYKTYLNEPIFENNLYGTIIKLIPSDKVLEPDEQVEMIIEMRPGVIGYFNTTFLLEIGHLPLLPIEVFGWGVIPQIYLSLPRPAILQLDEQLGYLAIPKLTTEYLHAVSDIFSIGTTEHLNSPLTEKCFEDSSIKQDWHICSSWDAYPSTVDIELAIERLLVVNHINLRPEILTSYFTTGKMGPIPGFFTIPYEIDFGVVITGSTKHCSVDVINYGPIVSKLHFAKGTELPTWLGIKLCGKLGPGESGKLEVLFSPSSNDFTELEQNVETSLNIDVPCGVTIPIIIKALCAVPYLVTNIKEINFGSVRCGDKIICSIPLKNIGKPACIWFVALKLKSLCANPMTVLDNSGKYEPGEGGWLSIAFKPTIEMVYEGLLIFKFHMNPNRMTIPVTGHGILPQVHVIGPNVTFPPTLPWSETSDIYFGLTNPCPFPIELIIAHSDKIWQEEESIYQLLYKYYNKPDEMLVPSIVPGTGLPSEVVNFHTKFKETVKRYIHEETQAFKASTSRSFKDSSKKTKSPKAAQKQSIAKELTAVKEIRSEAEIVSDVIKELKNANVDPLKESLQVFDFISMAADTDGQSHGILIFVYGSPCEEIQCQEMAYSIGRNLGIPTINIDLCIVEALCVCTGPAKILITNALNEMYDISRKSMYNKTDSEEADYEVFSDENEDKFDVILKKIEYLANNKNVGTPRSKVGDKKKKKSHSSTVVSNTALGAIGSTTMFQMDLMQELLTEFFKLPKFDRGFVVDTLSSEVITNPPLVLSTLIKAKLNVWNVHLILCQSDFNKWAITYEEAQRETDQTDENISKVYDSTEIENIIEMMDEMDSEEFENANAEFKNIYINYGLENRRRKHFDKVGNVKDSIVITKHNKDHSRSFLTIDKSESKKKIKKEDMKTKATSQYLMMNTRYNDYLKYTYENLINIANNWVFEEGDIGFPLYGFNGQQLSAAQKKTKKKSETQIQTSEVSLANRGFPLTIIKCPCLQYKEALVHKFATSTLVRNALREKEKDDILKLPVNKKTYTVLLPKVFPIIQHEEPLQWKYLDEPPIKKCECNQLNDLSLLDDTTQDNVINILSKWNCTCGKKVTSSQTSMSGKLIVSVEKIVEDESGTELAYPLPLRSVRSMTDYNTRIVLHPGYLVRCKYSFSPQLEGNFTLKRFVEISGWPESRVDINVSGICDLPRLDSRPKKMIKNFVRRTVEDHVYKMTYLDDQKLFQFGPIFIGRNRIYEERYTIDIRNSSLIKTDIVIGFLEETSVFLFNKSSLLLEPGCRGKIEVSAAPTEVGVHTSVLLFCIKDNPEIVTMTIVCSGVVPVVEILPLTKMIEYGQHLLYRRENDRFIVKNDSILPIKWKIRNPYVFVEDFIIAETSGVVQRHDNHVVPMTYIACRVGVISNKALTIDIYDAEGRGEPMLTDVLTLSAECYDVMVDCAYENPSENFLNYGNVKVNSTVFKDMYLLNRGKYKVFYKLKKVKNFPEPSLLRSFEAIEEYGVVPPTLELTSIEFECTPTTSMNLVNVPAYICSILVGSKDQVVVAKFPVCVTIASFYNTFTLFPLGELNFHIIPVGSGVMRDVILNNTSKCPVTYEIVLPLEYRPDPDEPPPSVKLKDNKLKNPPLKCGNFLILNDDNLLAPGTSRTLQIQFLATAARTFEETIHFIISDTCPAEAQGVPLKLVGTGAMPTLDFWNLETTFREHLIVKKLSEYKVHEPSPHCVFVEDSVTLHFFCVNVNSSYVAVVDLYNSGLVACALTMKLHFQSNSNQNIFSLDKYQTHIGPLLHKNLGIIFSPKTLEEYRAVLEIRLKLLQNEEQSFKICLIGNGVIPRICLIFPPLRHQRIALLHFPVTCLGSITNKEIRIKNISPVQTIVVAEVLFPMKEERPVFWLTSAPDSDHMVIFGNNDDMNIVMKMNLTPNEIATLYVYYNPIRRGRISCDVKLNIVENPYEYFTVLCEAEAFMEDVILMGLEMLPIDIDLDAFKASDGTLSTTSTVDSRKKSKSAPIDKKKNRNIEVKKSKRISQASIKASGTASNAEHSVLKYTLNFGGCELSVIHRRSVIMVNNSEKVYRFQWAEFDNIVVKPSVGYISPGEEKDIEIVFFSVQPVNIQKEILGVTLTAISDDFLTLDIKATTWDNRQTVTIFDHNKNADLNDRFETIIDEHINQNLDSFTDTMQMIIVLSALTDYTKYSCHLASERNLDDTFIYQIRTFKFKVQNVGKVPMKLMFNFIIDDNYPVRIDKIISKGENKNTNCGSLVSEEHMPEEQLTDKNNVNDPSKVTLFSENSGRDSVDTWFEIDLPFSIEPVRECLKPNEIQEFKVTFAPLEAFQFNVRLKSSIDNLDPYDQNISCKIRAKSLIPYVHLDIEESDYLTSERRKITGVALPPHTSVFEFDVLGSGCYKKAFNIINPTCEGYEFIFEMLMSDKPELIPMHCNMIKGYVEGGTSTEVVFTFSPTAPGVYESQWKFIIPVHSLVMHLLVVGNVREPDVVFLPTILIIRNSLVGFTNTHTVILRNSENESLNYEFKGNSLCNESGKTTVIVEPEQGVLKPRSDTTINIIYTPIQDGPLSFKIFCNVTYLTKLITLCVKALSYSIKPIITYYLLGNEHKLNRNAVTNIHLDQTASTYERTIPFTIKNDGSATFFFDWRYNTSGLRKYLNMYVEPVGGHVTPAAEVECVLHFTLKKVPVQAFPITLFIPDGPEYQIYLHAEIEKPLYQFSCKEFDFGRCIVNAPDSTYKKNIAFKNDDKVPIHLDLNFSDLPELIVNYNQESSIEPKKLSKITIFFRPKQVKEYEFKLQFWVNSLCEEIITIKGEGIPLLFDLFEGCQKSFYLGHVKVGEKIVRQIEVMNHSKVPIEASYIFRVMYPNIEDTVKSEGTSVCLIPTVPAAVSAETGPSRCQMLQQYKQGKIKEQITKDVQNALSSLKVIPAKCTIKPYMKVPLKIQFKPVGIISDLNVQLNMKVFDFERPLVRLSGSATGMCLSFSQNSLQFGRVRKRGCKILKVMLSNKGDFGAKFCWQPLDSNEFLISPMQGNIAAHSNVTFTITFRPVNDNPFIKVWACCNIENYRPLELALYATCVDIGTMQMTSLYFECPVREIDTQYIVLTNPSDDMWLILSEVSGGPFETFKEFNVEPNSTFEIPIHFKPKTIGNHESQVLFSPLGESALFVTLVGVANHPNATGNIDIYVAAKELHTENLLVHNITELPETYIVATEFNRIIPEIFEGYYEIKHPETIKVWGEAAATCRWTFVCYEECEINAKVMFINEESREYQFYNICVHVTASKIVDTVSLVSRARESVRHELVLTNPLATNAYFAIRCDSLNCLESLLITRNSEAPLRLVYAPLVVGAIEDILEVSNPLVGSYIYKVKLKCLPAKAKNLEFKTSLGSSIPLRLRVENKTEMRTDFIATVSHPSIITDKEYGLGPFEKGKFQAWFEPVQLGVQNCRVSFNSPVAGEYVFNIKGFASEPQPQGPYEIKAGGSVTINFKNIFEQERVFKIYVDREEFLVKTLYETVKAKKELKVTVYLNDISSRTPSNTTGCLTIETYEAAEPRVQWTYFLEGN